MYLVREKDYGRVERGEASGKRYLQEWVYPCLDRLQAPEARRDALLTLALVGSSDDLDRIRHVVDDKDDAGEVRWLAAGVHRRLSLPRAIR